MKRTLLVLLGLMVFAGATPQKTEAQTGAISIVAVDSSALTPDGKLRTGVTFDIYLTFDNNSLVQITGTSIPFKVSSPDGATWTSTNVDTVAVAGVGKIGKSIFDGGIFLNKLSNNGAVVDSILYGSFAITGNGFLPGQKFDSALKITIGPVPAGIAGDNHNKQICLDSSTNFPPTNEWTFADIDGNEVRPSWSGNACWTIWDEQTPVIIDDGKLPSSFSLGQNSPNPFNPSTEIAFELPEKARVKLSIYNVLGHRVRTLVDEDLVAGSYREVWDGRDDRGHQVTTGIYFYKLDAGSWSATKRMTFLK